MRTLNISTVEIDVVSGPRGDHPFSVQRQVQPLDIYEEYRSTKRSVAPADPDEVVRALYLRIGTAGGPEGLYGPIDVAAALPLHQVIAPFLIGQDALAGSVLWDRMQRMDRHSRHGHFKMAISAVDNALWDLRGKAYDAPVWQLLGGPNRQQIPAYASTLGTPHDEETLTATARELLVEGFAGQKWFLAYGPGEGPKGMEANIDLVRRLRAEVGPRTSLMFDAFNSWDLPYAVEWTKSVQEYRPTWLEEVFHPSQQQLFAQLRSRTQVPLATGEHLYDRNDVLPYLRDGALVALQCDPEWCGGVTELVRICALADTFGVPVIPHGHGVRAALHVVASQSPATCPMVEYLLRVMPGRHRFELNPPTPQHGAFALPTAPGFGIEFDPASITSRRSWRPQLD